MTTLTQIALAQLAELGQGGLGISLGIDQAAVRESMKLGFAPVDPLHRRHARLAQGQRSEGSGPIGLVLGSETSTPEPGRRTQLRVGIMVRRAAGGITE